MVEDSNVGRMHPDDLAAIAEALKRSMSGASNPTVNAMTGADARVIREFVADELERKLDRNLIEFREGLSAVRSQMVHFLPEDVIDTRIAAKFERIGLRVDDDHYEATGDAVRGFMKWHKRADKVISGIALSVIGAIVVALFKMIGITLPPIGGSN